MHGCTSVFFKCFVQCELWPSELEQPENVVARGSDLSLRCLSSLIISIWMTGDQAFLLWTDLLQNLSDGIYLKSWCFHPFTFTSAGILICRTQWSPFPPEETFLGPSKPDICSGLLGFVHLLLGHLHKGINTWPSWVFSILPHLQSQLKSISKGTEPQRNFSDLLRSKSMEPITVSASRLNQDL